MSKLDSSAYKGKVVTFDLSGSRTRRGEDDALNLTYQYTQRPSTLEQQNHPSDAGSLASGTKLATMTTQTISLFTYAIRIPPRETFM
jgi:hypothetical protein